MGFLSPWFLAGIAAIGLPLWVHLLRQFKRTPQPFSSLMFFERRVQSSTKHRRLRYLTLLALRMALLILLALAFASPFVYRTSAAVKRRIITVIAVDRSFSMRAANRMQAAKSQAQTLINSIPANQVGEVIAVDSRIESLTQPDRDRSVLQAAVSAIVPTDQSSSYGEFSRALRVMEQSTGTRLNVHFITDAQQTSMPAAFTDLQVGPRTSLQVHVVGRQTPNWAVESVTAPAAVFDAGHNRIRATITGWQAPPTGRRVLLTMDGKVIATRQIQVSDCGRTQVRVR